MGKNTKPWRHTKEKLQARLENALVTKSLNDLTIRQLKEEIENYQEGGEE